MSYNKNIQNNIREILREKFKDMDDDQQVAILLQLNLNSTGVENSLSSSWQGDLNTLAETEGKDHKNKKLGDHEFEDNLIQRDFEFVRKHSGDADPDFILSLLHSQIDNPSRLEFVMCEALKIPNALELIQEFNRNLVKVGDKRSIVDSNPEPDDAKKQKLKDTESYLQQMRDMFPDADGLFLISECQQLESWADFSRFVNTVMLSGVYPKKGALEYSPKAEEQTMLDVINVGHYRTVESLSSEEEISSSGFTETPGKRRRREPGKRNSKYTNGNCRGEEGKVEWLRPSEIVLVDLSSDSTIPDNDAIQGMSGGDSLTNGDATDMEVILLGEPKPWETTLVDDIDNLLETKFGAQTWYEDLPDASKAGPSGLGARPPLRLSLPGRTSVSFDDSFEEKSLSEIIEEKRNYRRRSLASPSLKPSTSKADRSGINILPREPLVQDGYEVSSPEVSTTSQSSRYGSETDAGPEEGEDSLKVNEAQLAEQTANLIRIFPNTDPSYLREEVVKMKGSSAAVNEFVIAKLEKNDMPSRAEYEKKLEMEELQSRYTKNFSIEDFLKVVPDPWVYFTKGNRNCAKYKSHSLCYLKSAFRKRYVRDIIDTFNRNNCNLYLSYQDLKIEGTKRRGSRRSEFECNHNRPTTIDIQFLQEVAFIENEEKIKDYLEGEKIARQIKFDEAKRNGSLLECQCCFDSEVMVEDIFYCPKDHAFCKNCIIRSVEVEMGYGRFKFECLASCEEKFTLTCLQNVLKPELFSKVIQAIQMEEIRAAGIDDLVQCPFCNYATIMPPEEKVMTCLNPECLKESCRLCKELNHIPLRCDEVEKSEEVKLRTYIENKMTEALVRTCYKCGKKFVKEDGCNKMTCTCGAKMCYVCRMPVSDYSHFNGQGGTEYQKCPLYSTNDELHVELVKRVGEEAKAEIMQANPHTKLLHDPTALAPERTHQPPMPGMNNGAALDVAMRAIRGILNEEVHANRQNRDRREINLETNPYYNRYHRHRQRDRPESEDEEEGHYYYSPQRRQYVHHHYHRHHPLALYYYRNRHHRNHHHHHHHHHHHPP